MDLHLTLSSAGTLCRLLKQWRGVGTRVPRPGLIYHCRHLSWKHLVQRCKSFNHTDSVMTKSRAPLGTRNFPTRCGNPLHRLNLGSSRPRLQNKERPGTSITNFVHIKDWSSLPGAEMRTPQEPILYSQPHHPHVSFHFLFATLGGINEDASSTTASSQQEYDISTGVRVCNVHRRNHPVALKFCILPTLA